MASARPGDRVRIHYTGRLEDGTVFDSTEGRDPWELTIGSGSTLERLEQEIVGMTPGDRKQVEIPARQAYGKHQRTLLRVLRPELVPPGTKVKVGQRLRIDQGDGTAAIVTVTGRRGDEIMVDMNHPLAGHDLTFDVELVEILQG